MSHFAELSVDFDQAHEAELVAALEKQFGKGNVEVHEVPKDLHLYTGAVATRNSTAGFQADKCHLIIRKENQQKDRQYYTTNDAGYRRTEDGKYKAFIDEAGFSKEKQGYVSQEYAALVSEKQLRSKGYVVQRQVTQDNRIQLTATKY